MIQQKVKIISNQRVGRDYFKLKFLSRKIGAQAKPGQFVMLRISDGITPFLRRPFGVHSVCDGKVEILYEVVGKGTQALSEKKTAERLDVIGPLGNGFDQRPKTKDPRLILVAGGMGVAPLTFLAEKLMECQMSNVKCQILALLGARTRNQVLCERDFKRLGCEVKIATDDGSRGFKGYVSELLKNILAARFKLHATGKRGTCCLQPAAQIYACGPRPMLKAIQKICGEKNIPCQASLEEHLACGVGACMGCAVKTVNGFKRVCKDGPVFDIEEVMF
ncbi:MAG: dihydroorotate dehydrogenase electron transfer subunit [Candidatus Omnitrophota bacterium]